MSLDILNTVQGQHGGTAVPTDLRITGYSDK